MDATAATTATSLPKISTCVITGLTGSGKTTLLTSLLSSLPPSSRVAVCIHHHAKAYGLETTPPYPASFAPSDPRIAHYSEVYDFGSGCICCSPDGDLTRTLSKLSRERELATASPGSPTPAMAEAAEPNIEDASNTQCGTQCITHCIIETTGLADPRPFTRLIAAEELIARNFSLDRIVAVVHQGDIGERVQEAPPVASGGVGRYSKAVEQLRNADAVVVNGAHDWGELGVGWGAEEGRGRAVEAVGRVNGKAYVVRGTASEVTWGDVMGGGERARDGDKKPCGACEEEEEEEYVRVVQLVSMGGHDTSYRTACCVEGGGVIWERAEAWIRGMLGGGGAIQVRGFLWVASEGEGGGEEEVEGWRVARGGGAGVTRGVVVCGERRCGRVVMRVESVQLGEEGRAKHPTMLDHSTCRETCLSEVGGCKVFVLGVGLGGRDFGAELRGCMVPDGFECVAEMDLDYPEVSSSLAQGSRPCTKKGVIVELEEGFGGQEGECLELALFCVFGRFYATSSLCPNAPAGGGSSSAHSIHRGSVDGDRGTVTCSAAECGACFDLRTGKRVGGGEGGLRAYGVRVVGSLVFVGVGGGE